jgi:hypothetical protein
MLVKLLASIVAVVCFEGSHDMAQKCNMQAAMAE